MPHSENSRTAQLLPLIAPSIATADLMNLALELRALEAAGADSIHFDVMDGHFVPLLTIGVPFLEQMRKMTTLHLDVHIMVTNPDETFASYLDAGADTLTFHIEAARHPHRLISAIKERGLRAGISINPGTPWAAAGAVLQLVDQVTIMGVNPGYSRQKHIKETAQKVFELHQHLNLNKLNGIQVQVDGGVSVENIHSLYLAGARNFVAGGAVFIQSAPPADLPALRQLKQSELEMHLNWWAERSQIYESAIKNLKTHAVPAKTGTKTGIENAADKGKEKEKE